MKSRLRKLYAHDRQFTWTARITRVTVNQRCHRCIQLRIWGAGKNSQVVRADLVSTAPPTPWGDPCRTDGAYPTPREVLAVIDHALAHGWQPDAIGGTFVLTELQHAQTLQLPNFTITDRLNQSAVSRRLVAARP
ncbi:integrase [Micromonospora sp. NPDC003197]